VVRELRLKYYSSDIYIKRDVIIYDNYSESSTGFGIHIEGIFAPDNYLLLIVYDEKWYGFRFGDIKDMITKMPKHFSEYEDDAVVWIKGPFNLESNDNIALR